ncbi:MAG TPA: TIGR03560 family F420-dependent LLM class oxidoreductase, partial [Ktedonobacteraceae bacterium]|nr:TIGR03560 family F420-dependent LLM class oxidoreductase [Ktedonobacteraceae bacterium]
YEAMARMAQEAERQGFHSIWLFDHLQLPTPPPLEEQMIFECWMSTAAIARDTTRIRLGQLVTNNSFRHPALVAKMASTIDVLSHGRFTLGMGAGWHEPEYRAYGYPFPGTATRLRQLKESLHIIRAMWSEEEAYFEGEYMRVHGAINQPKGVQKPSIPLLIGGKGEQITLRLVARYGDACNFTHPTLDELSHKFRLIERYCGEVGRNAQDIYHTIYLNCIVGKTETEALTKFAGNSYTFPLDHIRTRGLFGSPEMLRQRLIELEHYGVQEVIISRRSIDSPETFALLAQCMG